MTDKLPEDAFVVAGRYRGISESIEIVSLPVAEAIQRTNLVPLGCIDGGWAQAGRYDRTLDANDPGWLAFYICDGCNIGSGKPLFELQANEQNGAFTYCDDCWALT